MTRGLLGYCSNTFVGSCELGQLMASAPSLAPGCTNEMVGSWETKDAASFRSLTEGAVWVVKVTGAPVAQELAIKS